MTFNYKKILNSSLIAVAIIVGIYIVLKVSLYFIPFIVAFIVSSMFDPLISFVMKKLRFSRKASAIIVITIAICTVGVLLFFMILNLIYELISFSYTLPSFFSEIYENVKSIITESSQIYLKWPAGITSNINNILSSLSKSLLSFANTVISSILSAVSSIPNVLLFVVATILSIYFFSMDKDTINGFFRDKLPSSWLKKIVSIRDDMFSALLGYIKSQMIMMAITFIELLIGFAIIGIKPLLLLALILSFVDALPIIGLGSAIVPWAIYDVFTGDFRQAISLLVLYLIVVIIRQLVEPRILSQQIGIHPILTLMAMYGGLKMFGVLGLILGPVIVLLMKNIVSGYFKNKSIKQIISQNDA